MKNSTESIQELEALSKRLKDAFANPSKILDISRDVVHIIDHWGAFKEDSGGLTASQWLISVCGSGKNVRWWKLRNDAVKKFGEDIRRWMAHDCAVYLAKEIPEQSRKEIKRILHARFTENNSPLTLAQTRKIVYEYLNKKPVLRHNCQTCKYRLACERNHIKV